METLGKISHIREVIKNFECGVDEPETRVSQSHYGIFEREKETSLQLLDEAKAVWDGLYGTDSEFNKGIVALAINKCPESVENTAGMDAVETRSVYIRFMTDVSSHLRGLVITAINGLD